MTSNRLRALHDPHHLFLLHRARQAGAAWPVDVGDGRDPRGTELARRRRRGWFQARAGAARECGDREGGEEGAPHAFTNHRFFHMIHATTNITASKSIAKSSEAFSGAIGKACSGA